MSICQQCRYRDDAGRCLEHEKIVAPDCQACWLFVRKKEAPAAPGQRGLFGETK